MSLARTATSAGLRISTFTPLLVASSFNAPARAEVITPACTSHIVRSEGKRRRQLPLISICTTVLLFCAAILMRQARAQYLFNEQMGNHNTMAKGMVPGVAGSTEDQTEAIVAADFNGDGRMDIATLLLVQCGNPISNCWVLQTYLGQPDGSYAISSSIGLGETSLLAVGDVNGDKIPDLVTVQQVNGYEEIVSFIGKGDGTFQGPSSTVLPFMYASSLALGDFNGDGKVDAAVGDANSANLYVCLGKGDGTYTTGTPIALQQNPQQIIAADMNRDGKIDLVVSETAQALSVLLGNGDGSFGPELENTVTGWNTSSFAVGDMNGDGIPDLVTSGNEVDVFLGKGDGTFQSPVQTQILGNPGAIITGDFNGDGITDVAMGGGWTGVLVLLGNNDGTFKTPGSVYGSGRSDKEFTLLAGDFNNDGKLDLATAPYFSGGGEAFSILANNGDGTFGVGGDLAAGTSPTSAVTADFNGDGIPDFAIGNENEGIRVYLGTGKGQYAPARTFSLGNETPTSLVAGDFNRDGKIDLAAVNSDGTVSVLLGNGDGTFGTAKTFAGSAGGPLQLAAGDLNGDGNPDLVILNGGTGSATVTVLLGNADGSFQAPQTLKTGLSWNDSLQLADVNRDGKLDLLVNGNGSQYPTNLYLLLGNGDGTFRPGVQALPLTNSQGQALPAPSSFGVADLRGNGILDIVTADSNALDVWPGNGDGTFGQPIYNYGVGGEGSHYVFGDFNGDGKTDVAVCGYNDAIWLSLGNGDDTFGPQAMYNIPRTDGNYNCNAIVAGDFNGDGSLDVAGLNDTQNGSLTLLLNDPVLAFSSSNLVFPSTNIGAASSAIILKVTNQSYTPLAISSIAMAGADPADFTETDNCDTSLAAGASCNVTVTFAPTAAGTRNAVVTFNDSSAAGEQQIPVRGTAPGPGATLSPQSLAFSAQRLGTSSAAQSITLTNSGTSSLTISSVAATGDFTQSNTCPSSLAVGSACSISLVFTPTAVGTRTGTLTINDNAHGAPQTVTLSGTGASSGATLSPTNLSFDSQTVGTSSSQQAITLTNSGTLALNISSITASGDFSETQNCGTVLAPSANCTITVAFKPTTAGNRSGAITVVDDAPGSPQTVQLTGTAVAAAPAVGLTPNSLTFSSQTVGSPSAAQTVALTNSGSAALTISSIAASGDFAETNNCTTVAANSTCTISVTFTPTATGARTGAITIADNATGSPQSVSLTGTAVAAAPAVTVTPGSLTFSSQTVASTSAAQTLTLTNSGSEALAISSIAASGDFAQTNTCGSSVAAGANCTISVTFTPTASGARTGTLTITDHASGSPQTVQLSGTGASVSITPPSGSGGLSVSSPGGSTTATLQIGSAGGFSGTVNLTCAVAYTGTETANDPPTCSLNPAQETVTNGSSASVTLTVNTTAASSAMLRPLGGGSALAALACLLLIPRRRWRGLLLVMILGLAAATGFTACGGSSSGGSSSGSGGGTPNSGTTPGTYNVTVTATSGTDTASTTIPLSVQ